MADALISIVLEQLTSLVQEDINLVVGVRKEVGRLTNTLESIRSVVSDAEEKQIKNKAVGIWLQDLKEIVYVADDVLDEWHTRLFISRKGGVGVNVEPDTRRKVLSYISFPRFCFKRVIVYHDISQRIKKIRERLDLIALEKNQYHLEASQFQEEPRQPTSSLIDVSGIYGRGSDKEILLGKLVGDSSYQETPTQVISIVGMGGIGKTTLAKLLLKEEGVVAAFEKRMWVCVSEPFDPIGVAKAIIEEAKEDVQTMNQLEAVHQSLCKSLKGKRFILVLDDVWTENQEHWEPLKLALGGGAPGSRVIMTTRNIEVAKMMGSTYTHRLGQLSEDECWSLFRHIAFRERRDEVEKFEEIGKKIAAKCKGVPLAIKALANLMCEKRTKMAWRSVLTSDIWEVAQMEKGFLPSLFLSYNVLPSNVKHCFMYCAIFPKNVIMEKDKLIKLWMAQGFLGSGGSRTLEVIGEDVFNNLVMRSFFQVFGSDGDNEVEIRSCKMHDLIHDFAQFLTKRECLAIQETNDIEFDGSKVLHLTTMSIANPIIYSATNLRTLLKINLQGSQELINLTKLFHQLARLRALDLSNNDIQNLPSDVERLLQLRYLDLSGTKLLHLPEALCNLHNLQTLKLNWCMSLQKLPKGIGKLFNLRHLEIVGTDDLSYLPLGFGRLSFLRTLSKFIVGGGSLGCKIGELKYLTHINGKLEIMGLGEVTETSEASEAELYKKNLKDVILNFQSLEQVDSRRAHDILEILQPPEDLEILQIESYQGSQLPYWFTSNSVSDNVIKLVLSRCTQCTHLPALGKLASLEHLEIIVSSVKHIGHEFYGFGGSSSSSAQMVAFPKLRTLKFIAMTEWEEWELPFSKDITIMPCLSVLFLSYCSKLRSLPGLGQLKSLETLEIEELSSVKRVGLEFLGISHVNNSQVSGRELKQQEPMLPSLTRRTLEFLGIVERKGSVNHQGIFPKLERLVLHKLGEWEEWVLPDGLIMPCLREFELVGCPNLKALAGIGNFYSLENLLVRNMGALAEWSEVNVMAPAKLKTVIIDDCPKLTLIPDYIFSPALRDLNIGGCPQLTESGVCLPPLLEKLYLIGDVGIFSKSLPVNRSSQNSNYYSNLKSLTIYSSKHSSLPLGFNLLTEIQELSFDFCESLDFDLKELKHINKLQVLTLRNCPVLKGRFREGKDWSILSHVPEIVVHGKIIQKR
ncbi:hypothetical protein ACHQM5_021885 [Ranunculus cassubicifolius]